MSSPPRRSDWSDDELESDLNEFERWLEGTELSPITRASYVTYARRFLRWRKGDYVPRGVAQPVGRPVPAGRVDLPRLHLQLRQYGEFLAKAGLRPGAVATYASQVAPFLGWLGGTYDPGASRRPIVGHGPALLDTEIRAATASDFWDVAKLIVEVQQLHADARPDLFRPPSAEGLPRSVFEGMLGALQMQLLVATVAGRVVGYVYAEVVERGDTWYRPAQRLMYVHQLAVATSERRHGYGRRLMRAIDELASLHGIGRIELDTWWFNSPARQFFAHLGFREFNVRLERFSAGGVPARGQRPGRGDQAAADPLEGRVHSSSLQAVADLYARWLAAGRPRQPAMAWPRDRWLRMLPEHAEFLRALPAVLDREAVRAYGLRATETPALAAEAFIAVMAWGYGDVGFGPFRTARALGETPEAPNRLFSIATTLANGGPLAAYRRLASDARLIGLGPAFGTKFLYFTQPDGAPKPALILDRLVARWLVCEAGVELDPVPWSGSTYRRYLELMHEWAALIGCRPDELEYCMFQAMADASGGQWSRDGG